MGRTARDKRDRPHPPPVEKIELNDRHVGWRLVAAVVLLVVGGASLAYALLEYVRPETGWVTIEAESSQGITCGDEFVFLYEADTVEERKGVTAHYTRLCRSAYQAFHSYEEFEGVGNLRTINRHPNEAVEVDPALYRALETVEGSGSRLIYLGPVYERYNGLFSCLDDAQAVDFDPRLNEDVAREYRELAAFAADPEAVSLELLGENRVRLTVSEEYLAYAEWAEIENFILFSWTANAFIADYIADELTALGYTRGTLNSCDGYTRNLDGSGTEYSVQLYDRQEEGIYPAVVMKCQGPLSIVSLRDYPVNEADGRRFYQLRTGELRTPYLDPADGLCRNAVSTLTGYAGDKGCGEILLEMAPVYIAGELRPEALAALAEGGTGYVYCEDRVIYASDSGAAFSQIYEGYTMK